MPSGMMRLLPFSLVAGFFDHQLLVQINARGTLVLCGARKAGHNAVGHHLEEAWVGTNEDGWAAKNISVYSYSPTKTTE